MFDDSYWGETKDGDIKLWTLRSWKGAEQFANAATAAAELEALTDDDQTWLQ